MTRKREAYNITDLCHVVSSVLHSDALDDQLPLIGTDVLDGDASIVSHHCQVDGLDGFSIRFNPANLYFNE